MRRNIPNVIVLLFIAAFYTQITGCITPVKLRAADTLQNQNSMKKIVLIGAARVVRPRKGAEAVLSLTDSKMAVELNMPKLKLAFEKKGYQVIYAKPVGVGYKWPRNKENWVYTYGRDENGDVSEGLKYQISDGSPAYEYPHTAKNPEFRAALREEFEAMYAKDSTRKLRDYTPEKANLDIIHQVTSGDTICFVNVWGRQYSAGRKAGDMALGVLFALFGGYRAGYSTDAMSTLLTCSDVASGKVMWQNWFAELENPITPNEEHHDTTLKLFPAVSKKLPPDCKIVDKVHSIYNCEPPSSES